MKTIIIKAPAGGKPRIRQVTLNSGRIAYIAYREIMGCLIHSAACHSAEHSYEHLFNITSMADYLVNPASNKITRQRIVANMQRQIEKVDPWHFNKYECSSIYIHAEQP